MRKVQTIVRKILTPVSVDLGIAQVELLYNFNAIIALEEALGGLDKFQAFLTSLQPTKDADGKVIAEAKMGPSALRMLVWAGVQHQMPGTSQAEIGALMAMENVEIIAKAVVTAMGAHFEARSETAAPENPTQAVA